MNLLDRYSKIRKRIADKAAQCGRAESEIKLIAVSKTVEAPAIKVLAEAGHGDFAENRAQVLRDKNRILTGNAISWHFIGPLQTNKIKYVYPVASLVHSIDRVELIEEFIKWAEKTGRKCPILLEVHVSSEESKQGFDVDDVLDVISKYKDNEWLDIRGLMGMAPFVNDDLLVRDAFRKLRFLFEKSRDLEGVAYRAKDLSMGITNDFEIAIEEGATMLRIGSAIFSEG
jgi:hypothetical protein